MAQKRVVLSKYVAGIIRAICQDLYNEVGPSAVYDYANKSKMLYNHCTPCEADTPTISEGECDECAICGSNKYLSVEIKKS